MTKQKENESGRSMVEMLGVLAIIGVLSVMGIMGFKSAMTRHRANELLNEGNKRATIVAGQITMQSQTPSLHEFTNNTFSGGTFDTVVVTEGLNNRFGLKISNVEDDVCEMLVGMSGEGSVLRRISTESDLLNATDCQNAGKTYVMIYNNDMGGEASDPLICPEAPDTCPLNAVISGTEFQCPCTCPEHRATMGGRCGGCTGSAGTWTQPILSANGTMGVDDFACAASSHIDANRDAWRAFDNQNNSGINACWHSNGSLPAWLSWYTSVPIQIQSITIKNRFVEGAEINPAAYEANSNYTVKNFELQYSDDNTNWTSVYEDVNPRGAEVVTPFTINADSAHQYWRLWISSGYSGAYVTIGELVISAQKTYILNPTTFVCE